MVAAPLAGVPRRRDAGVRPRRPPPALLRHRARRLQRPRPRRPV